MFARIPGFGDLSVGLSSRWPRVAGRLPGAPSHVRFFDRDSSSDLLERTGFEPERIDGGGARSHMTGGSLKRQLARPARSVIRRLSGDCNLSVARPTG